MAIDRTACQVLFVNFKISPVKSYYLTYSGKFLLGGNFRNFGEQTRFCENKNCEKMN